MPTSRSGAGYQHDGRSPDQCVGLRHFERHLLARLAEIIRSLAGRVDLSFPGGSFGRRWKGKGPLLRLGVEKQKAALNGVPHLSVLDGWWMEGCIEGITGWTIGEAGSDGVGDAASLYEQLERTIILQYYDDRAAFTDVMRHAIALSGSFFNAQRMLQQYVVRARTSDTPNPLTVRAAYRQKVPRRPHGRKGFFPGEFCYSIEGGRARLDCCCSTY